MERFLLVAAIVLTIASFNTSAMVRTIWVKERSGNWYDNIVLGTFTHREWIENFRMTKETFLCVCNELRSYIEKQDTKLHKAILVDKRVAITLWRLASNADYRTIGHLFGVSKGSVCVIGEVSKAITATLSPRYIRIPSGNNLKEVINGFEHKWGFPQCGGAIDGSHGWSLVLPCSSKTYTRNRYASGGVRICSIPLTPMAHETFCTQL